LGRHDSAGTAHRPERGSLIAHVADLHLLPFARRGASNGHINGGEPRSVRHPSSAK
jgi:hypothetical protein